MATYVNNLRLKEIATGDEDGTWGTSTNTNLELIGEALGYSTQDCFASDANATTTVADGATDPARALYFKVTSSATLTATRTLTIGPNTVSRVMVIENATTGSQSIAISQGSGANVTIPTGETRAVYLDGAGAGAAVVDTGIVFPGSSVSSLDINGGTIDNTVIGGTTPAAVSGTTGDFSSDLTVDGNVGVLTTSPNKSSSSKALTVNTASGLPALELAIADSLAWHVNVDGTNVYDVTAGARNRTFYINGSEEARLNSSGLSLDGGSNYLSSPSTGNWEFEGNVGIGTTPASVLDIEDSGDAYFNFTAGATGAPVISLLQTSGANYPALCYTNLLRLGTVTGKNGAGFSEDLRVGSSGLSLDGGSNYLDTYTTGSWTPAIAFGGASTGITYSTQAGIYEVVGDRVFFSAYIVLTNKGSSTGAATITGLPLSSVGISANLSPVVYRTSTLTFTGQLSGHVVTGSTTMNLQDIISGGSVVNIDDADFANTTEILVSGHYRKA